VAKTILYIRRGRVCVFTRSSMCDCDHYSVSTHAHAPLLLALNIYLEPYAAQLLLCSSTSSCLCLSFSSVVVVDLLPHIFCRFIEAKRFILYIIHTGLSDRRRVSRGKKIIIRKMHRKRLVGNFCFIFCQLSFLNIG